MCDFRLACIEFYSVLKGIHTPIEDSGGKAGKEEALCSNLCQCPAMCAIVVDDELPKSLLRLQAARLA